MNDKAKEAYDIMAKKMDLDYDYKVKLRAYYVNHGEIPDAEPPLKKDHHRESFNAFVKDRFKCWRTMPKVVKKIVRAAKRSAHAHGLEKLTERAHVNGTRELNHRNGFAPVMINEQDEAQQ